jgi:hypothetical protein
MAVGLPLKTTYANGDVYSASDVNDTNGTVNLFQTSTLSSQAGKNPVINGGYDIWQRGTSISATAANAYTADRWQLAANTSQTCTVSRQVTGDTTNLPFIQYCARVQRNSGQTATGAYALGQSFESVNSIPFAGRTVVLSFYARRGSNFSSASNNMIAQLYSGTGTDQNILTGFTGSAVVAQNLAVTLTTTWQRFSITGTVASTATQLGVYFNATPVGTAGAEDFFEVTGVQLELGSVATTFSRAGGGIQNELAACQRYYQRHSFATASVDLTGLGVCISSTEAYVPFTLFSTLRVAPTSVDYANVRISDITNIAVDDAVVVITSATPDFVTLLASKAAAGFTTNRPCVLRVDPSGNGYIGISSEL